MSLQPISFKFDVTNVDPFVAGSDPVPAGEYVASITSMEVKANNNAATGHNLACQYTIQEGQYKGRKIFDNLNLWHSQSSGAAEVAYKQLASIGKAVGVLTGDDLTVLCNKPMLVEVSYQEAQPGQPDPNTGAPGKDRPARNQIVARRPVGAGAPAANVPNAAAASAAPAFNPAAQPAAAPQAAPAFNPAAAAAPAAAQPVVAPGVAAQVPAPTGTPGASTPPWLANKAA